MTRWTDLWKVSGYSDLSAILSGPMATMILGDQGADAIKVEPPRTGDLARYVGPARGGTGARFASSNRNKRSIVINLQKPAGVALLKELVPEVDVLVENFRPGVVKRVVNLQQDLASDPQISHDRSIVEIAHPMAGSIHQARPAARCAGRRGEIARHAPDLGEHTREVLIDFGLTPERIDALFSAGTVA